MFGSTDNGNICVNLNSNDLSPSRAWVKESTDFANQLAQFIANDESNNPVLIAGLPVDLTMAISLACWSTGKPVALIDIELPFSQLKSAVNNLSPSLCIIFDDNESKAFTSCTNIFNLYTQSDTLRFEQQLLAFETDLPLREKHWRDTEPALILYTSGSTGTPKGVCHSLHNLIKSAEIFAAQFDVCAEDSILNIAPIHTMSGFRCSIMLPLVAQCDTQIDPIEDNLSSIFSGIDSLKPTIVIAGPSLLKMLATVAKRVFANTSIRLLLSTGARLDRTVRAQFWVELNVPVLDYYGLTETCGIVIAESQANYLPSSTALGKACPSTRAQVVNEIDGEQATGTGELRVYSDTIFLGYWGQPMAKRHFFDTKDKVTIQGNGDIKYIGRYADSVKAKDTSWLHSEAIRDYLETLLDVTDHAVAARGDKLTCALVLHESAIENIIDMAVTQLGAAYREVQWLQVATIPRTNLGKIDWSKLEAYEITK